jgi:hypothetical protein
MVLFSVVFSVFFLLVALIITLAVPDLDPMVMTAVVTMCGAILATTFVWYFKKSQAENSVKIYVGAYKSIIKFRQKYGLNNDELCDRIENSMLQNLDDISEAHMDNAHELLEKVEVNV